VVMSAGQALQIGTPQEVFSRPANLFVAGFIGSPAMNLLRGKAAARAAGDTEITAGELRFTRAGVPDGEIIVGVRPECLAPAPADTPGLAQPVQPSHSIQPTQPTLDLEVDLVEPLGEQALVHGTVAGTAARSGAEEEQAILAEPTSRATVTAVFPAAGLPGPGDRVRVQVPPDRVYLFDAASGEAIW
jgi:multiple sugar transport system ATP-binding protein